MKLNGKTQIGLNVMETCKSLAAEFINADEEPIDGANILFHRLFTEELKVLERVC